MKSEQNHECGVHPECLDIYKWQQRVLLGDVTEETSVVSRDKEIRNSQC